MGNQCCSVGAEKPNELLQADVKSEGAAFVEEEISPDETAEEAKRRAAQGKRGKRVGISSESVSTEDAKNYIKPVYPKDNETKAQIRKTLKENEKMQVLFGHLDGGPLDDVINAFQTREAKTNQELIRQGDDGDCLYIIAAGEVDVYVARPGSNGKLQAGERGTKVVTLGSGALFGELALMYTAPRAATVVVSSPVAKLWTLDREPFKMLLMKSSAQQHQLYEGWLADVEIFKTLNRFELAQLSDLLSDSSTLYDTDEVIITQGEIGDKFYVLEDGTCAAFISGAHGDKEVKKYEAQGEYFGELALLKDEPRKATVKATGEGATVLSVSKEDFTNVLGPIVDILRKSADKYPQYADILR